MHILRNRFLLGEIFIKLDDILYSMSDIRKKSLKTHIKDALKDMVPQDPFSRLTKGEKDLDDLMDDAVKKMNQEE